MWATIPHMQFDLRNLMVVFSSLEIAYKSACFNFNFINKFPFSDKRHLLDFFSGHNFIYMWPENTFKKPEILEKNTKNLVDAKYNRLKIGWPLRPVRPKARPSHDILRPPWDSWDKITYQKHRLSFRFFGQIRLICGWPLTKNHERKKNTFYTESFQF